MTTDNDIRGGHTSASNAQADSLCMGRHQAQFGLPDRPTDYSRGGTAVHYALADPSDASRQEKLTLEQRETFDACLAIESKVVAQFFGSEPDLKYFREQRYWARFQDSVGTMYAHSGQADLVVRAGTKALIIDYKALFNEAPQSPKNMQLRDLACLVRGHFVVLDEIGVGIVQPHVTHNPQLCLYNSVDLQISIKLMFDRVVASNTAGAPRTAGEIQCAFCKAKFHCVEHQKWAAKITPPAMLSVMEVPISAWSPEQRAIAASALGPAEKFLEELKTFLKEGLAQDPAFVPGWVLEPGNKREEIKNPQEVFNRFIAVGGTPETFMPAVKLLKTKLKEQLSEVTKARGRALDMGLKSLIRDCTEVSQNKPSLKKLEGK